METKYPTLRRPKRKLRYLVNKESPLKLCSGTLTLGDIERMFDDLGPSSHDNDDLFPQCPLLQTFDTKTKQCERETSPVPQEGHLTDQPPRCHMGQKEDALHPTTRSSSPKLDIDLDIPFKAHMPVKTSSPIEEDMVIEELDNENDQVVCPILFACDDEGEEEAKTEPLLIQKPQCNGQITEANDDSELECPPSKIVFDKPKMSSHKNKVEGSCSKQSHSVKNKTPNKPRTHVLDKGKIKTPRQENADPPVSAVRPEPKPEAPETISENVRGQPSVRSTCVGKDTTAFLKMLRDARQPKPAWKPPSPVKVPSPPPEPDDDFLILEDESPLWFSIPRKTTTSKKPRRSQSSSTDKDGSTDAGKKDSPLETAQKQPESEQTTSKLGTRAVNQKTKKMKGKEEKNKVTEPGNTKDELSSPEDLPAGDKMEEEKPNKKKQRQRKVPSKESDMEEEQPEDKASPTLKTEKKSHKSVIKRSKPSKDGNEKAKISRVKPLQGGRKVAQASDAVKTYVEAGQARSQSSEEPADAEDLGSLPDEEIINSEVHSEKDLADEKDKNHKPPVVSEGSSSEDNQILGKRRRRQPGQWWLGHEITEETKSTDNQPILKKSKQYNQEPGAAEPSPVKAKKDTVSKKRNQTQPALTSRQNKHKAEGKKTKQNKNKNTRGDMVPDKVFPTIEAEQFEEQEQQDFPDQDQDVLSSPLDLSHRDHSLNSAPVPPRGSREQLRAAESERRKRKPPGNWWKVDNMCEDVDSISLQQQQPKAPKRRNKRSNLSRPPRLGTPKNGNMAVSSKPLGGAPASPLEMKLFSAPKTVKRSLATFKDIFTSVTETPTVVSRREGGRKTRCKITGRPSEEVAASVRTLFTKTNGDILSMGACEHSCTQNSPPNHETPPDSKHQAEDSSELFMSGPSSMIDRQQHEENDYLSPMPPSVHTALSVSDLCAPPLRPLVLQPKDKANLREWFRSLWSIPVNNGAEITPDHFDWYFYQGRAIGFQVDLNCDSFCNGKMLLGSFMKKPLWVDHSATTVFNLLTSSVSVTIDGKESRFNPGQSFMVPCGHAYNIENVTALPAVLYFTRMFAESSD